MFTQTNIFLVQNFLRGKTLYATVAVTLGIFFVVCRKGEAFCVRPFALHCQQHEKDKQNVVFASPLEKLLRTPMLSCH